MKKVISYILAILLCLSYVPCLAQGDNEYENFLIEETEDTVIIKGYKDPATTEIYVPGEINGKRVVLAEGAFRWIYNPDNRALEKVTIAEGITSIPKECFYFSFVKEVNLPESLTEIGERAFVYCSNLKEIDIKNVKSIGQAAFDSCENLVTITHSGKLENIGRDAFSSCIDLEYIDLSTVKTLGVRAFRRCRMKSVNLQSLEIWEGIDDSQADENGKCYTKQMRHYHGGQYSYIGLNGHVYAPFFECANLTEVNVRYPSGETGEKFPALFLNCHNVNSFTIENYQDSISSWEFAWLSFDNTTGHIYLNKRPHDMTVYSSDIKAKEYAEKLGWEFVLTEDKSIEVEPKMQGIHGGIELRGKYFNEHITKIAESLGGKVICSGENIAVQKDGKSLLITGDTVYYKENGKMVTENLYYDQSYIKIPEKALESVFGEDSRKSEKYKQSLRNYNGKIVRLDGTIETEYGTIVQWHTGGVMHGSVNELNYIRWDGEDISITNHGAPMSNVYYTMKYKSIKISEDGTKAIVTYPEIPETYIWSPGAENRVLRKKGTTVIIVDLVNCTAVCEVLPLKGEAVEEKVEPVKKEEPVINVEPAKTIEKNGMKVSVSILSEPYNGPMNMFDDNYISYCVLYVKDETNPEYMEFDLGAVKNVQQLALAFRDATERTTYFDVRVSTDGETFETVIPKRGSNSDTNGLQYFDINKNARYVRVYGYSNTFNQKWVSITEARVIAE